jgi:hypothetical protein
MILIPQQEQVLLQTSGRGTVEYACFNKQYIVERSNAVLMDNDTVIGKYVFSAMGIDAGYHIFTHSDGSTLKTKPLVILPKEGTLGWSKMGKVFGIGAGIFQDVGHVLRIHTQNGLATGTCSSGQTKSLTYECDYWFYI